MKDISANTVACHINLFIFSPNTSFYRSFHFKITKKKKFSFRFADLLAVNGEHVDIEPRGVTALEGQNITLMCRSNQPLLYCR